MQAMKEVEVEQLKKYTYAVNFPHLILIFLKASLKYHIQKTSSSSRSKAADAKVLLPHIQL